MASNGLVANQTKTEFLLLNENQNDGHNLSEIRVGNSTIMRTAHAKLLGVKIDESQNWNEHLRCLKASLNQRQFLIRRIEHQLPKDKLMSVVHSLWTSKLRYGLQLFTSVQLHQEDSKTATMTTGQKHTDTLTSMRRTGEACVLAHCCSLAVIHGPPYRCA